MGQRVSTPPGTIGGGGSSPKNSSLTPKPVAPATTMAPPATAERLRNVLLGTRWDSIARRTYQCERERNLRNRCVLVESCATRGAGSDPCPLRLGRPPDVVPRRLGGERPRPEQREGVGWEEPALRLGEVEDVGEVVRVPNAVG